ncbi:hypothetical protein EW145_g3770 [Phellinidium pouzarii]|uniref:Ig-like domain-containing protein n=1 Tax=Phellinidium pouzarii TaxID=167371 RepID=A0A4S4LB49_9AGAM|nr:hypothetical protein EW145_g3770 [Phellinidium pouzarii]
MLPCIKSCSILISLIASFFFQTTTAEHASRPPLAHCLPVVKMLPIFIFTFSLIPIFTFIVSDYNLHGTKHFDAAHALLLSSAASVKSISSDLLLSISGPSAKPYLLRLLQPPSSFSAITESSPGSFSTTISSITPRTDVCFLSNRPSFPYSSAANILLSGINDTIATPVCATGDFPGNPLLHRPTQHSLNTLFALLIFFISISSIFILARLVKKRKCKTATSEDEVAKNEILFLYDISNLSYIGLPATESATKYEGSETVWPTMTADDFCGLACLPPNRVGNCKMSAQEHATSVLSNSPIVSEDSFISIEHLDPAVISHPVAISGELDLDPAFVVLPVAILDELDVDPVDIALPDAILGELDINPADVVLPAAIPGKFDAEVTDILPSISISREVKIITVDAVLPIAMGFEIIRPAVVDVRAIVLDDLDSAHINDVNIETPTVVLGEPNSETGDGLFMTCEVDIHPADIPLPSVVSCELNVDRADIALPDDVADEFDYPLLDVKPSERLLKPSDPYNSCSIMYVSDIVSVADSIGSGPPGDTLTGSGSMATEGTSTSTDTIRSVSTSMAGNSMERADVLDSSVSVLYAHSATTIEATESISDVDFSLFDEELLNICLPSDLLPCDEFDESVLTAVECGLVPRFNDVHPTRKVMAHGNSVLTSSNVLGSILVDFKSYSSLPGYRDEQYVNATEGAFPGDAHRAPPMVTCDDLATLDEPTPHAVENVKQELTALSVAVPSDVGLDPICVPLHEAVPGELDIDPWDILLPDAGRPDERYINPTEAVFLSEALNEIDTRSANEPSSDLIVTGRVTSSSSAMRKPYVIHGMDVILSVIASAPPSGSESVNAIDTETGAIVFSSKGFSSNGCSSFSASTSDDSFGLMNISALSSDSDSTQVDDVEMTIGVDFDRLNESLFGVCPPPDLPLGDEFDDLVLTSVKRGLVPHFNDVFPVRKGKTQRNSAASYMNTRRGSRQGLGYFTSKQSSLATGGEVMVSHTGQLYSSSLILAPASLNPARDLVWKPPDKGAGSSGGRPLTTDTLPAVQPALVNLSCTPRNGKRAVRCYSREQTPWLVDSVGQSPFSSTPSSIISHSPASSASPWTPASSRPDPPQWHLMGRDCDQAREGELYENLGRSWRCLAENE